MYVCLVVSSWCREAWESLWELLQVSQNKTPPCFLRHTLHIQKNNMLYYCFFLLAWCICYNKYSIQCSCRFDLSIVFYLQSSLPTKCDVFIAKQTVFIFIQSTGVCLFVFLVIASLLWIASLIFYSIRQAQTSCSYKWCCVWTASRYSVSSEAVFSLDFLFVFVLPTWHFWKSEALFVHKSWGIWAKV